jgi:Tol biopolymer transport system component
MGAMKIRERTVRAWLLLVLGGVCPSAPGMANDGGGGQVDHANVAFDIAPDGRSLLFTRAYRHRPYSMGGWTWDRMDICTVGAYGTGETRVTRESYYQAGGARFTDRGRRVLFDAAIPYDTQFFPKNLGGSITTLLAVAADGREKPRPVLDAPPPKRHIGAWASEPSVTRDGKRVAYLSDRAEPFAYDVIVWDPATKSRLPLRVTSVTRYNQNPVITPDGKAVYYLAGTDYNVSVRPVFSLYVVAADGKTPPRRVAGPELFARGGAKRRTIME